MEKTSSTPVRGASEGRPTLGPPPAGWKKIEQSLASASGLSVLLVEGHQPPDLSNSNNNSICHAFQSSEEYAHLCDPYCGRAHDRAMRMGSNYYRCHVGLSCVTMPVELENNRGLAIIGGRAFVATSDYLSLAERVRIGDLQSLPADLFRNVIFAASHDLESLEVSVRKAIKVYSEQQRNAEVTAVQDHAKPVEVGSFNADATSGLSPKGIGPISVEPYQAVLESLSANYQIKSLALLILEGSLFSQVFALGRFLATPALLELGDKDEAFAATLQKGSPASVREGPGGLRPAASSSSRASESRHLELFPLVIGDELKGGLLIGDVVLTDDMRSAITGLCRDISLPMEVSRLKRKLERRERDAVRLQTFAESINAMESSEPYLSILRPSTALLSAERGSLMLFDEASNELAVKASIGLRAEILAETRIAALEGTVCGLVLRDGRPLVVQDLKSAGHKPAPADRHYKTNSFISYPISLGGRRVGILNVTDKVGGGSYGASDLSLLETMAPQMALALDRAEWREKAAQFQLMSITDPLTGMLNRRYLEERLTEELNRSKRYSYEMSFMMIDIDDFKLYNDRNGHQAGDLALEMTAQCLKSALRSADIASRYGGEEFCILLPQTPLPEARIIAERIRRRVERTRFPHGKDQPLGVVTISIGLSTFSSTVQTPTTVIREADRALYAAKHNGKNRVEFLQDNQTGDPILNAPE